MNAPFLFNAKSHFPVRRLKAFADAKEAFTAGVWFSAIGDNAKAAAWCRDNGLAIERAANEGVGPTGGFLVPVEIQSAIIVRREEYGTFRRHANVVPMSSSEALIPRRASGLSAYFPVAENAEITESDSAWSAVNLSARKLAALTRTSTELAEDAVVDLGEMFADEMAFAFAQKEDLCGFNGDGSSAYGGIAGVCPMLLDSSHSASRVVAASGHDFFAELDVADLVTLISKLPAYALSGAAWFISNVGFALTFCRLAANAGGILMQERDGVLLPTFMGFPVVITQALPTSTGDLSGAVMLAFGDLSLAATLGDRRIISIARSEHRAFEKDQIFWRGTERVDINVHDLGDASTTGPIVGLVGE